MLKLLKTICEKELKGDVNIKSPKDILGKIVPYKDSTEKPICAYFCKLMARLDELINSNDSTSNVKNFSKQTIHMIN